MLGGCAQRRQWLRINFTAAARCRVMMGCGRTDGPQLKRKVVMPCRMFYTGVVRSGGQLAVLGFCSLFDAFSRDLCVLVF